MAKPVVEDALHELDRATFALAISNAVTAERERCAKIAAGYDNGDTEQGSVARAIASGIRQPPNQ